MKVVYNARHGGFSISDAAIKRYAEIKGITLYPENDKYGFINYWTIPEDERTGYLKGDDFTKASLNERIASNKFYENNSLSTIDINRDDPVLVQVVEELGEKANGPCAKLKIEDVPKGALWRIDEYDGMEKVMTQDTYDWSVAT